MSRLLKIVRLKVVKFDQTVLSDHEKGLHGDCTRAVVYTIAQKNLIRSIMKIHLNGISSSLRNSKNKAIP